MTKFVVAASPKWEPIGLTWAEDGYPFSPEASAPDPCPVCGKTDGTCTKVSHEMANRKVRRPVQRTPQQIDDVEQEEVENPVPTPDDAPDDNDTPDPDQEDAEQPGENDEDATEDSQGEDTPADNSSRFPGAPAGLILAPGEPVSVNARDEGTTVVVLQDVYRQQFFARTKRPTYTLVYKKGARIPKTTLQRLEAAK